MRILDEDNDKAIKSVTILLTLLEAIELRDDLDKMLQKEHLYNHTHINDIEYKHEITVAIYNTNEIESYNERIKKVILKDE